MCRAGIEATCGEIRHAVLGQGRIRTAASRLRREPRGPLRNLPIAVKRYCLFRQSYMALAIASFLTSAKPALLKL